MVLDSLKELAQNALEVLHTRFELLVTEIAEEQSRLAELLLHAVLALVCLFLAAVLLAALLVASLWDTPYRLPAIGASAAVLLAAGAAGAITFVRKAKAKPRLFSTSLGELGADLARLK